MRQVQRMDGIAHALHDVLALEAIGLGEDYREFFTAIARYGFCATWRKTASPATWP